MSPEHTGETPSIMKQNAINWFEIFTNDLAQATAFYEAILNTKLQPASGDCCKMAIFPHSEGKGIGGALTQFERHSPGAGGTLVYLNVEGDLDGVLSRIPEAGGTVLRDRIDISPHGFIAIFKDPEGNVVGLHSLK